jgi:hypothetical protein
MKLLQQDCDFFPDEDFKFDLPEMIEKSVQQAHNLFCAAGVMATNRGTEIRFVAGKHIGWCTGYPDGEEVAVSVPVIVSGFKKKDGSTCNKRATVRKMSACPSAILSPQPYSEAIMQQHPNIKQMMVKLCRQLAKCELNAHSNLILEIFSEKLQDVVVRQRW